MKFYSRYLVLFLLLISVLSACRFSGYSARYLSNNVKESRPVVFPQNFSKALYKTDLSVYGRPLSGITVVKKDTLGYHVALVSEVGLKYYELFFPSNPTDEVHVVYLMEVMNHPPVVSGLKKCFGLLFREPVYDKSAHLKMNETGKTCLLYNHDRLGTTKYFFDWISGEVELLHQKKIFTSKTEIKLSDYEEAVPGSILMLRGKLSIQMIGM